MLNQLGFQIETLLNLTYARLYHIHKLKRERLKPYMEQTFFFQGKYR